MTDGCWRILLSRYPRYPVNQHYVLADYGLGLVRQQLFHRHPSEEESLMYITQ